MVDSESEITLSVLNAVERNSRVTQRDVAKNIGIALGLTNAYLKRCIKKGLIKVQQVPANRYAYYLTPKGFAEKSRLTGEFLSQGFQFFRLTRSQLVEIFENLQRRKWSNVVLHGLTDISEIAVLCASNFQIKIVGIVDKSSSLNNYAGIPIVSDTEELSSFDAIVITDLGNPEVTLKRLKKKFPLYRIFAPQILNLSHQNQFEDVGA